MPQIGTSGNPGWKPGTSGNPNGRPTGSRNKRTSEIVNQIIASNNKDPLLTLSDLQANSADEGIRATAANMLAPYLHSKLVAAPAPRYIEQPFTLPNINPTTEAEISANIGRINAAYATGELDYESCNLLLIGQHQHVNALKAREDIPANQNIHITGGLPPLPGCNITMPQLNGHETLSLIAPNDPPITPPQDPDQPPAIPPEQEEGSAP